MKCDHCSHEGDDVEFIADPFLDEIYEEIEESWLCDSCYDDRRAQV